MLQDHSPPLPPTRLRLERSTEARSVGDDAGAPVGETSLERPLVPSRSIRDGSSVTIPEVAMDMFENSCLLRDLQHLSSQGLHMVMEEFASCWAKVRNSPL